MFFFLLTLCPSSTKRAAGYVVNLSEMCWYIQTSLTVLTGAGYGDFPESIQNRSVGHGAVMCARIGGYRSEPAGILPSLSLYAAYNLMN